MKLKLLFFLIFFQVITVSNAQETSKTNSIELITNKNQCIAGSKIKLEFKVKEKKDYTLYCTNSYGTTIINPKVQDNKISFTIPSFMANKKGILSWRIINSTKSISGKINVLPKQKPSTIETYLGPPSIEAGGSDFTMLVVIPTDNLDNPLKNNSKVLVKHQFLTLEKEEIIYTNKIIGYKNIFSPLKSGRMIISSESNNLNSKEFDVNIMPAIATNFKLFVHRNHEYADGNQITTFYTSIIKDKNNNIVSDGSYIEFFITNKKGNILKTAGTTINGIAKAKIIHPDYEEKWKIKAYFTGISESNTLEINYKKIIENYTVFFSKNNRNIKIGPLKSFMSQMIPDGLSVQLLIYKNDKIIDEINRESKNGFVKFYLNPNIFKNDIYNITIKTAGIKQEYKNVKLW